LEAEYNHNWSIPTEKEAGKKTVQLFTHHMSYEVVLALSTNVHVFKLSLQRFCHYSDTSVHNGVNKQSIICHIIKHHPHHSQLDVHQGRS
jgi:hypothetical protein